MPLNRLPTCRAASHVVSWTPFPLPVFIAGMHLTHPLPPTGTNRFSSWGKPYSILFTIVLSPKSYLTTSLQQGRMKENLPSSSR